MKQSRIWSILLLSAVLEAGGAMGEEMVIVDKGVCRVPIIVAEDASQPTRDAAKELVNYIKKVSGASPELLASVPDPVPSSAIWVGMQPKAAACFPGAKLEFQHPEEILLLCNGKHLLIAGRDVTIGEKQIEHGTVNAIYTFIEKKLDVRWLWPGELGEDIIRKERIAFPPFEYRFHPIFLKRLFWPRQPIEWHKRQRLYYHSSRFSGGHAFTDWWDKYHEAHPDWFALQPSGTRNIPESRKHDAKLCLSNPGVWKQWLDNAEEKVRADPTILVLSATPNDGPYHCVCEKCRAWDPPNAPRIGRDVSLTDRHVKFWNILARGLRERFPDRELYVGAYAYGAYLLPPVAEKLEKNIIMAHVGHFPLTSPANREEGKRQWKEWAEKATMMLYRPNLWYWAGGVWSMPEVAIRKTIEDFRFLAENKCTGIEIDVLRNHWSTQGPTYYLMAQLTYDPLQDGVAVMKDYYQRGFGPAAEEIEQYWNLMEDASDAVMTDPEFRLGSQHRYKLPPIFVRVYNENFFARADNLLKQAEAKVENHPLYRRRVAYVRAGLEWTRLLVGTIPLMTRLRQSSGRDLAALEQATKNWEEMERLAKRTEYYGLGFNNARAAICGTGYQGGMQDYFGPPSEEFRKSATTPVVQLRPAEWKLVFSDDFKRNELGPDWKPLAGQWTVRDGVLISSCEGTLISTRKFTGLHRLTFDAMITPDPGVSDISPFIQAGPTGHSSGYILQFGGYYNTISTIQRLGQLKTENRQHLIQPGKLHSIVAEFDGTHVRLIVDGQKVVEYKEIRPLVGPEHEHIGFYTYQGKLSIRNVKLYTSPAVPEDGRGYE